MLEFIWKLATYSAIFHALIQFSISANYMWWFMALFCITSFCCWSLPVHSQPANKTPQYNHPLWPLNLTARLLNTSKIQRSKSFSLFGPLSPVPSPLYLYCLCVCPSSISPPAWAAVALSESPEFPIHCSVSAWKHHRCQLLGKLQNTKTGKNDRMKMSVMANRTLSQSYNISVTDLSDRRHTHTHTNKYHADIPKRDRSSEKTEGTRWHRFGKLMGSFGERVEVTSSTVGSKTWRTLKTRKPPATN